MNVSCPECHSVFRVDPAKVTGAHLRARCSICGGLIPVGASIRWAEDFPTSMPLTTGREGAGPSSRPTPVVASAVAPSTAALPHASGEQPTVPEGPGPMAASTPASAERQVSMSPLAAASAGEAPVALDTSGATAAPVEPSFGTPAAPDMPGGRPVPTEPVRRPTPLTPAFGAPIQVDASLRPPTPSFVPVPPVPPVPPASAFGGPLASPSGARAATPPVARPVVPRSDGSAAPAVRAVPVAPFRAPLAAPSAGGATAGPAVAGAAAPASSPAAPALPPGVSSAPVRPVAAPVAAPTARRVINPFLSNDPNQKARRLARALVSDMVAYHPQKREEGARAGTLKQLFREEIKKSYEEYVEQVGREFAESTTHFQESLNDILAGGKRIF